MQKFKFDTWQKAVLEHQGNICMCAGRQVGKSTVIGMKAAQFAAERPNTVTLVIAASQKQAGWIFDKIKGELMVMEDKGKISFKEPPTKTKAVLKNGAQIHCLPAGRMGYFIRGLTIDMLIADEAAYIPEEVWKAVVPMIAVSRKMRGLGWIILLSTPFGKGGYFYNSFHDSDFRQFHVSSEQCSRIPKDFLRKEQKRMTKMEYAQEYLGEFVDEWNQFFPTPLIKKCMTFIDWSLDKDFESSNKYFLGVDIARYGGDENAFVVCQVDNYKRLKIIKTLTTDRMALTDTVGRVLLLDKQFKRFKRIFVDDAGVGGGVMDMLLEKVGRRVVGLNNASRSVDKTGKRRRILKEDMYSNALMLMETGQIDIISDLRLLKSMKSIVFEYTGDGNVKIHGLDSHLTEGFVRACWCMKDMGLRVFLA